jgi:hypothetical protein
LAGCAIAVPPSKATVKAAIIGVRNIANVSTEIVPPASGDRRRPAAFNVKEKIWVFLAGAEPPFIQRSGRI